MRILIVEDETLIALDLQTTVAAFGHDVMGPVGRLATALDIVEKDLPDAALLDVRLWDETSFPLADRLIERGIPVIFVTANDAADWPMPYRAQPVLRKPVRSHDLARLLEETQRRLERTRPRTMTLRPGMRNGLGS